MSENSAILSGATEKPDRREQQMLDLSEISSRLGALKSERLKLALADLIGAVSDSEDYQQQASGTAQSGSREG